MNRTNALAVALADDDPVFGAAAATVSQSAIETIGALGYDFVWIDLEHGGPSPTDSERLAGLSAVADAAGIELLVRLPDGDPATVRKVLDAGIRTILIPRIETASEVRHAVRAAKFEYDGKPGDRGVGIGRTTTWGADITDHTERADRETLVGVMIENESAVENLESILSVPELGFAFVGPADLSVSLGEPLDTESSRVRNVVTEIEETVADSDVSLAGIHNDSDAARDAIDRGYRILRVGGDLGSMRQVLGQRLEEIQDQ